MRRFPAIHSLTAADVASEVEPEAARQGCCPEQGWEPGLGYAGGGFGAYRQCQGCGAVFGKQPLRDGNEGERR